MTFQVIIILLLAIVGGVGIGVLMRGSRSKEAENMRVMTENLRREIEEQQKATRREIEEQQKETRREFDEQQKLARHETVMEFRELSTRLMQESQTNLKQENSEQIEALLKPMKERLDIFSKAMNDAHVSQTASTKSLNDQIDRLLRMNMTISEDARNLTSALKGDSKMQGDWGEMMLETLLENAGMKKDIHYRTQVTDQDSGSKLRNEDGRLLRPDVIVSLPSKTKLVIDSKVSLIDYTRLLEAKNEDDRQLFLKKHVASVKKHVDELDRKNYQKIVDGALEHVLMFMPVEGAYLAAIQADTELWKYAYDRHVVIVSPTHIFSVMQIISQMWRQDSQNKHAAEIAKQAGGLYDVFVKFTEEFEKVGRNINLAAKAYDDCEKRLSRSNQSLVSKAERLRTLGAKTSRRLNQNLLNEGIEEPESEDQN